MSATKIPAQHVLRRSGDEMKCLYCSYTEPLDPPRSPAQPDALELLRELHAKWPDIRQLQDGFMANSPGENWSEWDQQIRQWCIEFGPRIDAFLRGGSGG